MEERVVIDRATTPDGKPLELAIEDGNHIIRVDGVPLMSSALSGSEEAMAEIARDELGPCDSPRILIGGLGMGFTLRATLDEFDADAEVCVAELMGHIIRYNREVLADLNDRPVEDPRVDVFAGDVKHKLEEGGWDVILMDVDNGPTALTARSNHDLYGAGGAKLMSRALASGGVLVVWSAYPSPRFVGHLRRAGLHVEIRTVRAGWPLSEGPEHSLFVAIKPTR